MQKLRSMTETIKMLSDENEMLKRENERIRDEEEGVYTVIKHEVGAVGCSQAKTKNLTMTNKNPKNVVSSAIDEGYEDMNKRELIALTVSYDQKVKALSEEIHALQREIIAQSRNPETKGNTPEPDDAGRGQTQAISTGTKIEAGASKDKYKTLARRLKDERNQFRETCEVKQ